MTTWRLLQELRDHTRPDDDHPSTDGLAEAARALVQLGMTAQQARVALAVIAPKGQGDAYALTIEYLVWRSRRRLQTDTSGPAVEGAER